MIIFWNIKSEYIISCCMVKMKFSPKTYRWIHVKLVAIISIHINIPSDIMAICFMRTIINLILMPCLSMFRVGGKSLGFRVSKRLEVFMNPCMRTVYGSMSRSAPLRQCGLAWAFPIRCVRFCYWDCCLLLRLLSWVRKLWLHCCCFLITSSEQRLPQA